MTDIPADRRMLDLAHRFPTLRSVLATWDPLFLDHWACSPAPGSGAFLAAQFLLGVWNRYEAWKCGPFDFHRALSVWDRHHREAFLSWAQDPVVPDVSQPGLDSPSCLAEGLRGLARELDHYAARVAGLDPSQPVEPCAADRNPSGLEIAMRLVARNAQMAQRIEDCFELLAQELTAQPGQPLGPEKRPLQDVETVCLGEVGERLGAIAGALGQLPEVPRPLLRELHVAALRCEKMFYQLQAYNDSLDFGLGQLGQIRHRLEQECRGGVVFYEIQADWEALDLELRELGKLRHRLGRACLGQAGTEEENQDD